MRAVYSQFQPGSNGVAAEDEPPIRFPTGRREGRSARLSRSRLVAARLGVGIAALEQERAPGGNSEAKLVEGE